ncbi:hypothetical protein N7492_007859 [Penicillium capsulatum]|uniref:Secreted protein CSS2 C-terminal domain-containing protein n=1 Tax=Penicillium capsulatum TaxID=69766 RepID=A0A9W9LL92_9EURO|nr:hypothetical protein N7492_007859 [Penicillium capsulatum]KAJ6117690.1 hypothetical protein N7512_007415 [Penicillium capsulatum]
MLSTVSGRIGWVLLGLFLVPGLSSALTAGTNSTATDHGELVSRTADKHRVFHQWAATSMAILGASSTLGIVMNGIIANVFTWVVNKPDANKICGKSKTVSVTGDDGAKYKYYAYSYTTGDNCDTTQRAMTLSSALADAFNDLHKDRAMAVCLDLDHGGTWHGVVGLATEESGIDPQKACADHHKGAKRSPVGFRQLPESAKPQRAEAGLEKRTGIDVTRSSEKKESTTFSEPNRSQSVIAKLAFAIYKKNLSQSCQPVTGPVKDRNGVTYHYHYRASGRNCDTTAEYRTIVSALDKAWDKMGDLSAVCMTLDHGGTWRGHLGVSAMHSEYPADKLCD